jgi:hypothetical protein
MKFGLWIIFLPFLFASLAGTCFASRPACQAVLEAVTKVYTIPVHLYTFTATPAGKTSSSEIIYANNITYVLVNGQWRATPVNQQEVKAMKARAQADTTARCAEVREEPVDGEAAVLYTRHTTDEDTTIDSQLWVSKKTGLPLKQVINMDAGTSGKNHQSVRYDYVNVSPPTAAPPR